MSDRVLQHVLADLRPSVLAKLRAESDSKSSATSAAKKLTVDTHRGEFYQFCYFLRKTEPHSVLIKKRLFTAASSKRKLTTKANQGGKKKKRRTKAAENSDDEQDDSDSDARPDQFELDIEEEEEEKPKPIMQLKYQGFNIYNHSLCIVVEPWPALSTEQIRATSVAPTVVPSSRQASIAPPDYVPSSGPSQMRAKTPLFLPDEEDLDDDETLPINPFARKLPPVPLFNDPAPAQQQLTSTEGPYGMMELSQVLSSAGNLRAGAAEEEEEEDNEVFFADADEVREFM